MATVLDTSLLQFFLPAFTFLFITILSYAMLKTTLKQLNNNAVWVASICIGLIALFSGKAVDLINFITPWYVVIFVFLLLTFTALMFWGQSQEKVWASLGGETTIVVIGILILVLGISQVFGPVLSPYGSGGTGGLADKTIGGETIKTLFHPRVLGSIFILIIAAFSVQRISETVK